MSEALTQICLFQPTGETGWLPLGNVWASRAANERKSKTIKKAEDGYRRVIDEQVSSEFAAYELTLSERDELAIQVLFLANASALISQLSGSGIVVTIPNIQHMRFYDLGKRVLTSLSAAVGASVKTDGVDYVAGMGSGLIMFLPTGTIAAGATVTCTFNHLALNSQVSICYSKVYRTGTARIYSHAIDNPLFIQFEEFAAVIHATDPGQRDGNLALHKFKLTQTAAARLTTPLGIWDGSIYELFDYPLGPLAWNSLDGGSGWRGLGAIYNRGYFASDQFEYSTGTYPSINGGQGWAGPAVIYTY